MEYDFGTRPIEELAAGLPTHVLGDDDVEAIRAHLEQVNGRFALFTESEQSRFVTITAQFVKYSSPRGAAKRSRESMAAYLFFWFWMNQQKDSDRILRLMMAFAPIMQRGAGPECELSEYLMWMSEQWPNKENMYRFLASFEDMACAMLWEVKNWDRHDLTFEQYDQVRVNSIATQPWYDAWNQLEGHAPVVRNGTEVRRLEYLCRRLQYLANDLCSVERDLRKGGANLVLIFHHGEHLALDGSITRAEKIHADTRQEVVGLWKVLEDTEPSKEELWYIRFLLTCTAGNVLAMANTPSYYRRVVLDR